MKIDLVRIIKSDKFLLAVEEACKLNKPRTESGFLVQARPRCGENFDLDNLELKINKPITGHYVEIDLDDIHKCSFYGLPKGKKGEGFYLENGFYHLIHLHFHIPNSTMIYSEEDIAIFCKLRKQNINRAKRAGFTHFINPLFVVGNKKEKINFGLYIFSQVKNKEYNLYQIFFELNEIKELPKKIGKYSLSECMMQKL